MKKKLPFDVPAGIVHRIPVEARIYAVMREENELTAQAIALIEDHWCNESDKHCLTEDDDFFGLFLPVRYGVTAPEEKSLDHTLQLQKAASADMLELSAEIAEELKMSVADVRRLMANSATAIASELIPYSSRILDITAKHQELDYETKIITVLIRRAIPAWTDDFSAALHPVIASRVLEFEHLERNWGKIPGPPTQTSSPPILEELPVKLELANPPIGIAS